MLQSFRSWDYYKYQLKACIQVQFLKEEKKNPQILSHTHIWNTAHAFKLAKRREQVDKELMPFSQKTTSSPALPRDRSCNPVHLCEGAALRGSR